MEKPSHCQSKVPWKQRPNPPLTNFSSKNLRALRTREGAFRLLRQPFLLRKWFTLRPCFPFFSPRRVPPFTRPQNCQSRKLLGFHSSLSRVPGFSKMGHPLTPANPLKAGLLRFHGEKPDLLQLENCWPEDPLDLGRILVRPGDPDFFEGQSMEVTGVSRATGSETLVEKAV